MILAIVVAQLAVSLNQNISSTVDYLGFVFLFVPVWWSWLGVTFYNTRFETDDLQHRLLTLLQMAAAAFLAINVVGGLGNNSVGFALSYAVIRTLLVFEYLLTGRRVKSARPLTDLYSKGFMATTIVWFLSALVPPPFRFYLWLASLAVDIAEPVLFTRKLSNRFAPHIYHLPERLGAFTIIVLGVTILAFVDNIATHKWTLPSILSAALSLSVTFCIWWIYFDSIDGSAIRAFRKEKRVAGYFVWLYIHFPLLVGIVGFGASMEHIVLSNPDLPLPAADRWLMCGSIALCLLSMAVIRITSFRSRSVGSTRENSNERNQAFYTFAAAGLMILFSAMAANLLPLYLILGIAVTLGLIVALDIRLHPIHRVKAQSS